MIRYCQLTLYVYLLSCIEHLISICNVDVLVNDCRLVRCSAWTSTLMGGSNYPLWTARRRVGNFGAVTLLSMIPLSLALLLLAVLTWWLLLNNIKKIQFSTLFSNPFFWLTRIFSLPTTARNFKSCGLSYCPWNAQGSEKRINFFNLTWFVSNMARF